MVFRTKGKSTSYVLLAAIILAGLALSFALYSGPFYNFDDLNYITYAHQFLAGSFNPAQSPYAYGFLLPLSVAVSFRIFGISALSSILPTLASYVTIIIVSFLIGKKLYGDSSGLIAALFVAMAPFVVGYSTRVLPDMGVGALAGISIMLLIYGRESKNRALLFLSGAFAFLTIYVKLIGLAYVLSFIIAILYCWLQDRKRLKKHANSTVIYALSGAFALGAIYAVVMFAYSGSVFGPFLSYGSNQATISPSSLSNNIQTLYATFLGYSSFSPLQNPQIFPLGLIIFLAVAGTAIGLIKREGNANSLSIALWIAFIYLFFGTVTMTKFSFIYVVSRYLIMVAVPMAVLAAYAVFGIYKASIKHLKGNAVYVPISIIILVLISYASIYPTIYNYNISISGNARTLSDVLGYVKANSGNSSIKLVTLDNSTSEYLEFLSKYDRTMSIYTLNTTSMVKATKQLDIICEPGATNTYMAIAYENYSKLQYTNVFDDWIRPDCALSNQKDFNDSASSSGAYNDINVYVELYKVN